MLGERLRSVEPLQSLCMVSRPSAGVAANGTATPKKKWTVLVYLNAANNLEPFGIKELAQSGLLAIGRGGKSITERVLRG